MDSTTAEHALRDLAFLLALARGERPFASPMWRRTVAVRREREMGQQELFGEEVERG